MRQLYGLSPDETAFLLDAVEHYCATRCPLAIGQGSCAMLAWRESHHTGAVERVCKEGPAAWRGRLGATGAIRCLPQERWPATFR